MQGRFELRYFANFGFPYGRTFVKKFVESFLSQIEFIFSNKYKCIIVDGDNTLWGGVLSESINDIELSEYGYGFYYKEFQRVLDYLYHQGIILCLCTKNDIEDINKIFLNKEMVLKKEQFAIIKANWNNKVDNIKEIINELNIDYSNVIFVDDSIFEVEAVKYCIPEVSTLKFSHESIYDILDRFNFFFKNNQEEISLRNGVYLTNPQRMELRDNSGSYSEYLTKLKTEITISRTTENELKRISDLSFRTNKCTNGKRYCYDTLSAVYRKKGYVLYSIYARDIFSEFGLIGVVGIYRNSIDLFSLSCRILGRNVEEQIFNELRMLHNIESAYCIQTNKNADFYRFLSTKVNIENN